MLLFSFYSPVWLPLHIIWALLLLLYHGKRGYLKVLKENPNPKPMMKPASGLQWDQSRCQDRIVEPERCMPRCLLLSSSLLPDFGIAGHFINRVVNVHCILDHCAILKHLDLLGHTSDGEVVTVTVKLNTETKVRTVSGSIKILPI